MKNIYFSTQLFIIFLLLGGSCADQKNSTVNLDTADSVKTPDRPAKRPIIPGQYVVLIKEAIAEPVILHAKKNITDRKQSFRENEPKRKENLKIIEAVIANCHVKKTSIRQVYADLLVGFSAKLSDAEVKSLKLNPHVKAVYEDYEAKFQQDGFAWQTFRPDQFEPYEVQLAIALSGGPLNGAGKETWIWIIDSGIDLDHPDLNVVTDEPYAVSFTSDTPEDDYGHGTIVAGMAAAINNNFGTCGVSSGAWVVPVKVGQPGFISGYGAQLSSILSALNHIAQYDIPGDVVNISIASYEGDDCNTSAGDLAETLRDAVELLGWSGVWVCSGAGNNNDCTQADKNLTSCINSYHVISVGGMSQGRGCTNFSYGTSIDWLACTSSTSTYLNGVYAPADGTSLASPIVAGIIHARGGAPVSAGNIQCCVSEYKIAHLSPLNNLRFDADLELVKFEVNNVRDWDGNEDIFGRIDFTGVKIFNNSDLREAENLWSKSKENAIHTGNGSVNINKKISLLTNISYDELRNIQLKVGGEIKDEEGIFGPRIFKCQECKDFDGDFGTRAIKFLQIPSTLESIHTLEANGLFQALKFGGNHTFELNFYESNNKNDGWIKVMFKVYVRPRPVANPTCLTCHAQGV